MSDEISYRDYVADDVFMGKYFDYQKRYADEMRESDRILVKMVGALCSKLSASGQALRLLDIGCSTGNFLFHLHQAFPNLDLTGGDMAQGIIQACEKEERLKGIHFKVMNMLEISSEKKFDIIAANATAVFFEAEEYEKAVKSAYDNLRPGGWYIAYEWIHEYTQELQIIETSRSHPEGLKFYFRSMNGVKKIFEENGFTEFSFHPFVIQKDLKKGETYSDNADGSEDLNSFTRKDETGERMMFRGALYQPWCHFQARKPTG